MNKINHDIELTLRETSLAIKYKLIIHYTVVCIFLVHYFVKDTLIIDDDHQHQNPISTFNDKHLCAYNLCNISVSVKPGETGV